ncbi:prion-inhibition and propagation-domain-containing protein [Daldinia decipiens]|uniref:prion-inhibition and propagation-domain-containing protein n=1 Tax=Daldinia decipiens TaxID=326647 RepID=UPI0020C4D394|nr:prion-inhibition and propagation-domain-containing protein [Daldinia decipiens]KAI1658393.1 prion-inhibition and propagation-domain-containing protein [Daldinia decipiens]
MVQLSTRSIRQYLAPSNTMDTTTAISIFQIVIETLGRIQLAREFTDDFTACQLKLDITQLRLSRWGEIANISTIDDAHHNTNGPGKGSTGNDPILAEVKEILEGIQKHMELVQSEMSRLRRKITETDREVVEVDSSVQGDLKKIRNQFLKFLRKRELKVSKTIESIKWVFYKKDYFDKFIKSISERIQELEETIPEADREKFLKLSNEECKGLGKSDLEVLKPIVGVCDPWLEESVNTELGVARDGGECHQPVIQQRSCSWDTQR